MGGISGTILQKNKMSENENIVNEEVQNVDVKETKDAYLMDMDLPGLTEKDVEISLKDYLLSISSVKEAKTEKEEKKDDGEWLIKERSSMQFMRRFSLPNDIDADAVKANFANGVLSVIIPRKSESSVRTIAINA